VQGAPWRPCTSLARRDASFLSFLEARERHPKWETWGTDQIDNS
jgi:hypothetical protein